MQHNLDIPDWIAADAAAYVELAPMYCEDVTHLARLRNELRPRLSAINDRPCQLFIANHPNRF